MICARCGTLHPTEDETGDYPGSAARVSRCGAEPSPKLRSYLEQENAVLHSKLRQLEIKLEKAEKALAVEREECAQVVLNCPPGFGDLNRNDVADRIRQRAWIK